MKDTVRQLKSACLSCALQRDSTGIQYRGDGGTTTPRNESSRNAIKEMKVKMTKMSTSLKNAHTQIKDLQGQVEQLRDIKKVMEIVGTKVDNSSCLTECPFLNAPLRKSHYFTKLQMV